MWRRQPQHNPKLLSNFKTSDCLKCKKCFDFQLLPFKRDQPQYEEAVKNDGGDRTALSWEWMGSRKTLRFYASHTDVANCSEQGGNSHSNSYRMLCQRHVLSILDKPWRLTSGYKFNSMSLFSVLDISLEMFVWYFKSLSLTTSLQISI